MQHSKMGTYLKIVRIEMEDLQEDLNLLIQRTEESWKDRRITERVYLENQSVYRNEIIGLEEFRRLLTDLHPAEYGSLENMIKSVKQLFLQKVREHGLAEAVWVCVCRKLDKAARYVCDKDSHENNPSS